MQRTNNNSSMQRPNNNSPMQRPNYNSPMQRPNYNNPMQRPNCSNPMQGPNINNPMQRLNYINPIQRPNYNNPMQRPNVNNPMQRPNNNNPMQHSKTNNQGNRPVDPSKPPIRKFWKKKKKTQESKLQFELATCLKQNDLTKAISLYESALSQNYRLTHHHFNQLLHLCSQPEIIASHKSLAIEYGFRVYDEMRTNNILPTEATITELARLAAAKDDPHYAFELVKNMKDQELQPKLRTYGAALYSFCDKLMADEAYSVEEHMKINGIRFEEAEVAALLKVSVETGRGDRVYGYLHKLRGIVRIISESPAAIVERWFRSEKSGEFGMVGWDVQTIAKQKEKNGGGWHGMGWLGKGPWEVKKVNVSQSGVCHGCGEQLVCVDIDVMETEKFAQSVAGLAMERELKSNFQTFMDWIDRYCDYETIVDGANIALYQQNFAKGGMNFAQLESTVNEIYSKDGKWPLVILHNKRASALRANPYSRRVIDDWMSQRILYATPTGSNDDWYWLYAAVRRKCLIVTNDEMRDHIFELLGSSFFLQWKERHQVHYTFARGRCRLLMPPIYSIIIQESIHGSWHVPLASETSDESARQWLCVTRPGSNSSGPIYGNGEASSFRGMHNIPIHMHSSLNHGKGEASNLSMHSSSRDRDPRLAGKRKERSPPPPRPYRQC